MVSDSGSGGSHISATPPRKTPPLPPPHSTFPTAKSRTRIITKTSTTALNISRISVRPANCKRKSKPPPKLEPQPLEDISPAVQIPTSSIPTQFIRNDTNSQIRENAHEAINPAAHRKSRLFFVKSQGKILNLESDEISKETKSEIPEKSAVGLAVGKDESSVAKIVQTSLILVGRNNASGPVVKKPRCVGGEGNFVKLNINGYGRKKFKFKNKRNGCSTSSRRRTYPGKRKKTGTGDGGEEGPESEFFDEEGLVVDVRVGDERLGSDTKLIEEAVSRVREDASDENLLKLLKLTHGYDSFRDGQLEAVKMVIGGKSTMLVLPTGAGKSLCYQLPALVLQGVTIVVSPLVALMIDQLKHLPPAIRGALLCSSQTTEEASETLRSLQEGLIKVLFVSPERFLNSEFLSIFSGPSQLSLVVVDEAHCVSEWSHNFRPSYMRLRASLLCGRLNAGCILAMTATATTRTLSDVMHALEIPTANLIQSAKLRDNLRLSVSMSGSRL